MDLSSARARIKLMKRKQHNSIEDFRIAPPKKTRTAWLKANIQIMDALYGEFNLLMEYKHYNSTKDRVNTRLYFVIEENNLAGLIKVIIDTKKMTMKQGEMRGYISAHALERIFCSEYAIASADFLSAYVALLKSLDKPSWEYKEGLNIYTPYGVFCAIRDCSFDDDGKQDDFFMIKTFIQAESFDLGSDHDRNYQKVLETGEMQKEFVRKPKW